MSRHQDTVGCENGGNKNAYEDEAEGFCDECGSQLIVNEELFYDRLEYEMEGE